MDFFYSQVFIRAVGIIGFILGVAAFQSNKHKTIVVTKMGSEAAFTVQYFLLDAYTGSIMNFIGIIRNFFFFRLVEKNKSTKVVMWVFCAIYVLAAIVNWEGPESLLPLIGKLCSTVAFSMKNTRYIRIINIPTLLMWVIYSCIYRSWEAFATDSISLISVLIAMVRYDIVPYFKQRQEVSQKAEFEKEA